MKRTVIFMLALSLMLTVAASASSGSGASSQSGIFGYIFDFIFSVVVPPEGYFTGKITELSNRVNEKLGSASYLYQLLNNFFVGLRTPGSASLKAAIPNNFLYQGFAGVSSDFLSSAAPYFSFMRAVSTVFLAIITAASCYRILREFFSGGGGL